MANAKLIQTVRDIRSLKIQGSSAVRRAIVLALKDSVKKSRARSVKEFRAELKKNALLLAAARPTEPETRTALRIILKKASAELPLQKLREAVLGECTAYEKNRKNAMREIARIGARELKKCSTIFTHCHSHTVEAILLQAKKNGTLKRVINTETRPRWQGRITSMNLAKAGIPVTHIVDSAAGVFLNEADAFVTGADAILASGAAVNKIGTSLISLKAKQLGVPHYIATSSHSFDPATYYGEKEEIEQRAAEEVWGKKIRGVEIRNPAFDTTEARFIKAIICEKGVLPPKKFTAGMEKELGLKEKKFVSLVEMLRGK